MTEHDLIPFAGTTELSSEVAPFILTGCPWFADCPLSTMCSIKVELTSYWVSCFITFIHVICAEFNGLAPPGVL